MWYEVSAPKDIYQIGRKYSEKILKKKRFNIGLS